MKEAISAVSNALKAKFLSESADFKERDDYHPATINLDKLNTEENEFWLVQCPKSLDPSQLTHQKIKLPGKSTHGNLETFAVEFPAATPSAFGFSTKLGHSLKLLPIQGSIVIREKLKLIKSEHDEDGSNHQKEQRTPSIGVLKQRHPLHGFDYESKINLEKSISDRLKAADHLTRASPRKLKKQKAMESIEIESDDGDDDVLFVKEVTNKKDKKKKKRKHDDDADESRKSSKKSKKSKEKRDDGDDGLQWINNISVD